MSCKLNQKFQPILCWCNFHVRQLKSLTKGQHFIFIKKYIIYKILIFNELLIFQPTFEKMSIKSSKYFSHVHKCLKALNWKLVIIKTEIKTCLHCSDIYTTTTLCNYWSLMHGLSLRHCIARSARINCFKPFFFNLNLGVLIVF